MKADNMGDEKEKPIFREISAEDVGQMPMIMESLCISCEEQGETKLLLVKIPYFREVILSSFECPHCGYKNNEVQPATDIQDKGLKVELKATSKDLNRQVVKAISASVTIPEIDFEIPAFSQKGELSTIEGILSRATTALAHDQPVRKAVDPENAEKIDRILTELGKYKDGKLPFTFVLDDMSGNSFLENPYAPQNDEAMTISKYTRTTEQDEALGLYNNNERKEDVSEKNEEPTPEEFDFTQEVLEFPTNCSNCQSPVTTNMKAVDIPFFKQVILMATACSICGKRTNEVKSGAGIEELGKKIILKLTDATDLNRDVLKSDTCVLKIPELEFELQSGTLGGRFTTVEGLLVNVKESIQHQHPFGTGDTPSLVAVADNMKKFLAKLDEVIEGKVLNVHFILDDPAGNSYLQNVYAPDKDPNMTIEKYERTQEQNDELGLSELLLQEHKEAKENASA